MARSLLLASVLGVATGLTAAAQDAATQPATQPTQPAVEPAAPAEPPRPLVPLTLRELMLELGFEASFDRRAVRYDRAQSGWDSRLEKQTNRATRLEETLGLRSSGTLFDEKFALFDIAALYGLTQSWYAEARPGPDRHEDPHGSVLEYDLNLTLFPRGRISANAYAQRLDSRVPRSFLPSLDRTLERYGGGVFLNDPKFPMRFTFEHSWDELTSRTRDEDDDERRGNDTFRYEGTWQISDRQSLRIEYEYNDRAEQYSGSRTRFDTTRHYVTLNHVLRFGKDGRSSWETLARLQEESGDLARDNAEVTTRLRLQHSDAFATNWGAQYYRDAFADLETETWRGEGGFTWQYARALTVTGQLYGLQQQADRGADFREWGGLLNAAYSQDNALGRFSANLSYNHASIETSQGSHRGIVIGESVTFRDPLASYLAQNDIDWATIVVTDANRSRTYLPIRDYLVVRIGRYTALRRVPTGQIADRQTVLVSYTYRVSADYAVRRDRVDLRIQQDFSIGLTAYYAGSLQDESYDTQRYLAYRERDVQRHRLGATFRRPKWSVGLEYECNDDNIDPYQAVHANGDVVLWQKAEQQLDARLNASYFSFRGEQDLDARDTLLVDLGASYRYLFRRDLEFSTTTLFRYEDDSLYGTTNGIDLSAALDWKIGYFSLRCEAEYDLLSVPSATENSASFWLKLKRDIPVIKRPSR